eukprot:1901119-Heterocapsa_arctica.AAC.1
MDLPQCVVEPASSGNSETDHLARQCEVYPTRREQHQVAWLPMVRADGEVGRAGIVSTRTRPTVTSSTADTEHLSMSWASQWRSSRVASGTSTSISMSSRARTTSSLRRTWRAARSTATCPDMIHGVHVHRTEQRCGRGRHRTQRT